MLTSPSQNKIMKDNIDIMLSMLLILYSGLCKLVVTNIFHLFC